MNICRLTVKCQWGSGFRFNTSSLVKSTCWIKKKQSVLLPAIGIKVIFWSRESEVPRVFLLPCQNAGSSLICQLILPGAVPSLQEMPGLCICRECSRTAPLCCEVGLGCSDRPRIYPRLHFQMEHFTFSKCSSLATSPPRRQPTTFQQCVFSSNFLLRHFMFFPQKIYIRSCFLRHFCMNKTTLPRFHVPVQDSTMLTCLCYAPPSSLQLGFFHNTR